MPPTDFSCLQCGHCCLSLGFELAATAGDVARWEEHDRDDILAWVDEVAAGIYDIWIHPRTGEDVDRCPWLRKLPRQEKFICRIQDMKPEVCRNYPVSRKQECGCKIWLGSRRGFVGGIAYRGDGSFHNDLDDNSFNEAMNVESDGYALFLKPLGMAHMGRGGEKMLTQEGTAEYLWGLFIEPLR